MSECYGTKSLSKGIMIVFKTKGPQIRCIPHGSLGLSQCKSSCKKHAGWWNLSKDINKFKNTNVSKYVVFTGGEGLLNVNRPAKTTLVLIKVLRICLFTKERRTLKPWFWVEKRTRYLNVNRAAKNTEASSDKNLSVKPYSLISCCFKRNL